ncbi:MAG: hypothetical protein ACLUDY_10720 [Bacteroides xylanisolvens]
MTGWILLFPQDGYKLINTCDTYLYIVPATQVTTGISSITSGFMRNGRRG